MVPEFTNIVDFSSDFESGNLDRVYFRGGYEFDLYMKNDANTMGHNQWFYFKMKVVDESLKQV